MIRSCRSFLVGLCVLLAASVASATQLSTTAVNFGAWPTDAGPIGPSYVWVLNDETTPTLLTPADVYFSGEAATDFILMDGLTTTTLYSRQAIPLPILFDPSGLGEKTAELSINLTGHSTQTVSLKGSGSPTLETKYYDGQGPGISTVGPGGMYANLTDIDYLTAIPLTGGNWTFLLLGSTSEPGDIILSGQGNGNTLLFRPYPGNTDIVIEFTTENSRLGILNRTHVVFDGSSAVGGSDRNLRINTPTSPSVPSNFTLTGNSDYNVVRNLVIRGGNSSTGGGVIYSNFSFGGFYLNGYRMPDHNLIEQCELLNQNTIYAQALTASAGENQENPLTRTFENIIFRKNIVKSSGRGLTFFTLGSALIQDNHFELDQNSNLLSTALIYTPLNFTPMDNVRLDFIGNDVTHIRSNTTNSAGSAVGLLLDCPGENHVYNIINNSFGSVQLSGSGTAAGVRGIHFSRANLNAKINILHNSINIETGTGNYAGINSATSYGIGITNSAFNGKVNISNNIIRVGQLGAAALNLNPGLEAQYSGDYNNLFAVSGITGVFGGAEFHGVQEWSTATGLDAHSTEADPAIASNSFAVWTDAHAPITDLHFVSAPSPQFLAPRISSVAADIDGDLRGSDFVIKGADEVPFDASRHFVLGAILGMTSADPSIDANEDELIDAADVD